MYLSYILHYYPIFQKIFYACWIIWNNYYCLLGLSVDAATKTIKYYPKKNCEYQLPAF